MVAFVPARTLVLVEFARMLYVEVLFLYYCVPPTTNPKILYSPNPEPLKIHTYEW